MRGQISFADNRPVSATATANMPKLPRSNIAAALVLLAGLGVACAQPAVAVTYVVNTTGDPGPAGTLSLRQAITSANSGLADLIRFAPSLAGSTITLKTGEIDITTPMIFDGTGAPGVTISGDHKSRIFRINNYDSAYKTSIYSVALTQGTTATNGGAIFASKTKLKLMDVKISDSAAQFGGGLYVATGALYLFDSTVRHNQSLSGGGITLADDLIVTIVYSTVSGNSASYFGGGIYGTGVGYFSVAQSTISGNRVEVAQRPYSQGGGGIALQFTGQSDFVNATIANNYAGSGGSGVALLDGPTSTHARFESCTVSGNTSPSYRDLGLGIIATGGTVTLLATIVSNNVDGFGYPSDLSGTFNANFSLIGNSDGAVVTGSSTTVGVDAQLSALGDHGGPTQTMIPALTSPAIDRYMAVNIVSSDQRGRHRPAGAFADIGAVERQYPEDLIFRDGFNLP